MKKNIYGVPPEKIVRWIIKENFKDGLGSWVDVGCGGGDFTSAIGIIPEEGLGVDVVGEAKGLPIGFKFLSQDVNLWLKENCEHKFDLVSAFEIIEHFEKKNAIDFIEKLKLAGKSVCISTPSGFLRQDSTTHPEHLNNPWQHHRCGFSPEDLENLGFTVFVLKNFHYKPVGNDRTFDKLVAYRSERSNHSAILRSVWLKSIFYQLVPRHFYRTIRDIIIRPLR